MGYWGIGGRPGAGGAHVSSPQAPLISGVWIGESSDLGCPPPHRCHCDLKQVLDGVLASFLLVGLAVGLSQQQVLGTAGCTTRPMLGTPSFYTKPLRTCQWWPPTMVQDDHQSEGQGLQDPCPSETLSPRAWAYWPDCAWGREQPVAGSGHGQMLSAASWCPGPAGKHVHDCGSFFSCLARNPGDHRVGPRQPGGTSVF